MTLNRQTLQLTDACSKPIVMPLEFDNKELSQLLVLVALKRDKQAFTLLFKFFAPQIKRIASKKFSNSDLANEVVQETLSNVWRKAHLFKQEKGQATTWVFTIMRNVTFDLLRKIKANREDNLSEDIWPLFDSHERTCEDNPDHLEKDKIIASLQCLSENQQQVIKGFYFLEMSQEQLAEHLNIPLGTVKSRLRLALEKLKQQLGEDYD